MIKAFDEIIKAAKEKGPKVIAVAVAQDIEVLTAVNNAMNLGIANAILVGDKDEIAKAAKNCAVDINKFEVIEVSEVSPLFTVTTRSAVVVFAVV